MPGITPIKYFVFALALIPLVRLLVLGYLGQLTANPVEFITRSTGTWTITLLCITLSMSPMRWMTGWSGWIRLRRMLGLFTFLYAAIYYDGISGVCTHESFGCYLQPESDACFRTKMVYFASLDLWNRYSCCLALPVAQGW